MAALEAQAAGVPVLSSPLGGLPETVKGGVLTYDYINGVSQLRNKSKWGKLSASGKEYAATRGWETLATKWLGVLEDSLTRASVAKDGISETDGKLGQVPISEYRML